jgi:hypothetical protein
MRLDSGWANGTANGCGHQAIPNGSYLSVHGQLDETTLAALGVTSANGSSAWRTWRRLRSRKRDGFFCRQESAMKILAATNAGLFRTNDRRWVGIVLSTEQGMDSRTTCISTSAQNPSVILSAQRTSECAGVAKRRRKLATT